MSILEIELTPETTRRLAEKAKQRGLDIKAYAEAIVIHDVQEEVPRLAKHSIMELHGIGKGAWDGVDVQEYIDEMRDEWDKPR